MSYMKRLYEEILEQVDWSMSDEEISELTDIPVDQIESAREMYEM